MALTIAPATALAAEADGPVIVSNVTELTEAIESASPGDTIVLKAGRYEIGDYNITKQVNLEGAGSDNTILEGTIFWGQQTGNISVSNLTMQGTGTHVALNIQGAFEDNGSVMNAKTVTVDGCVFRDYEYAIGMNTYVEDSELTVKNTQFMNTGCAVALQTDKGNTVSTENVTVNGGYAVQSFGTAESEFYNGFYEGFDISGEPDLDATKTPISFVTAVEPQGTLVDTVREAGANSVIMLTGGEYDVTTEGVVGGNTHKGTGLIIDEDNVTVMAADPENKPVIYGFSTAASAGVEGGINGQDTIYVAGKNVTLKDLKIMPLGGVGNNDIDWQKTVEVTADANGFVMTGCETVVNDKRYNDVETSMSDKAGVIHISSNDAKVTGNIFGEGTSVCSGWATSENGSPTSFYVVDASGNTWATDDIGGSTDGIVIVDGTVYVNHEVALEQVLNDMPANASRICLVGQELIDAAKNREDIVIITEDGKEFEALILNGQSKDELAMENGATFVKDGIYYSQEPEDQDADRVAYKITFNFVDPSTGAIDPEWSISGAAGDNFMMIPAGEGETAKISDGLAANEELPIINDMEKYSFLGWYKAELNGEGTAVVKYGDAVTPETEVADDMSVYAGWATIGDGAGGAIDQPSDKNDGKTDGMPKTGDDNNMAIWAVLMIFAAAGATVAAVYRKKTYGK